MKLSISLLAASLATADAGVLNNLRRRLSFEKVATYAPGSQVSSLFASCVYPSVDDDTSLFNARYDTSYHSLI